MKLKYILSPPKITELEGFNKSFFFKWNWILKLYHYTPSGFVILSIIVFLIFALYFNLIVNQEKIFNKKSYVPAIAFMLFTSFLPTWSIFSTTFVANMLVFIAFAKVITTYNISSPEKTFFTSGVLIALSSFFFFPAILFFILFIVLILILRPFKLQEFLAFTVGVVTPYYFLAVILFLLGKWNSVFSKLNFQVNLPLKTVSTPIFITIATVSIVLLMYGLLLVNQSQGRNTTAVRKKWNCIGFYYVFASIVGAFSLVFPSFVWIFSITPFSIVLAQSLHHHKEKFNTFTFYILLILLFAVQWWMQLKFTL